MASRITGQRLTKVWVKQDDRTRALTKRVPTTLNVTETKMRKATVSPRGEMTPSPRMPSRAPPPPWSRRREAFYAVASAWAGSAASASETRHLRPRRRRQCRRHRSIWSVCLHAVWSPRRPWTGCGRKTEGSRARLKSPGPPRSSSASCYFGADGYRIAFAEKSFERMSPLLHRIFRRSAEKGQERERRKHY